MALFDEVKQIIAEELSVDANLVTPEAEFIKDLNADSLDVVELIMALEEKFNVDIPDEEASKIQKVSDVVTFIETHKK
ncbi:acyl carrier protein [Helicobacter fennelliae]|uniref:Acyl carrier protein n=2 Tax=Helicobacter fennelliae TaxID=215 RepID=T1CZG9_9HELI|nr:acyl carrier protein [Helicobacter fennelliae]GAD18336.1 acyl carrier protein [Helicobacter fennelliae MRY12-0050]SQB97749.1 acyl carrier protein [Helicobacter fennelliae]STP06892.1 acyl carrier protein [Helicobacter fennelliae]STQ83559.1 acyl carrier protein [Helicobacter fennelliae]